MRQGYVIVRDGRGARKRLRPTPETPPAPPNIYPAGRITGMYRSAVNGLANGGYPVDPQDALRYRHTGDLPVQYPTYRYTRIRARELQEWKKR